MSSFCGGELFDKALLDDYCKALTELDVVV
jgi:hypothetical protein